MSIEALALSATMALAAGLVGCFAVMRRMALAGDALSHVALPGIGVALALHIHPLFGAVAMLLFAKQVAGSTNFKVVLGDAKTYAEVTEFMQNLEAFLGYGR